MFHKRRGISWLDVWLASSTECTFRMYLVKWDRIKKQYFYHKISQVNSIFFCSEYMYQNCIWWTLETNLPWHILSCRIGAVTFLFYAPNNPLHACHWNPVPILNSTFTSPNKTLHCTVYWPFYKTSLHLFDSRLNFSYL